MAWTRLSPSTSPASTANTAAPASSNRTASPPPSGANSSGADTRSRTAGSTTRNTPPSSRSPASATTAADSPPATPATSGAPWATGWGSWRAVAAPGSRSARRSEGSGRTGRRGAAARARCRLLPCRGEPLRQVDDIDRVGFPDAVTEMEAPQHAGGVPVGPAGQTHEGRYQRRPDEERVDEDGDGEPDPEPLHHRDLRRGEGHEHQRQQQGGGGHDPARPLQADGHGVVVGGAEVDLLLDAGQEEDLVVHREPEGDAEEQHRGEDADRARRREVQQPGEVPVLEDEDEGSERRRQAEDVERQGFQGDQQAADHEEQQHEGAHRDQRQRQGEAPGAGRTEGPGAGTRPSDRPASGRRKGTPSTPRTAVTITTTATGRRITARARRYQNPSSTAPTRWRNSERRSIRRPSTARSAG